MSKEIIHQVLQFKDWPLKKVRDEKFFGYVVSMGVFPKDWCDDGLIIYADFAYNDSYERYRIPNDPKLISKLNDMLMSNLDPNGGIYGKVWIRLNPWGYDVELP